MGKLSRSKSTRGPDSGNGTGGTRRRAYPRDESLTVLREGRTFGHRGNARHHYDKKDKKRGKE